MVSKTAGAAQKSEKIGYGKEAEAICGMAQKNLQDTLDRLGRLKSGLDGYAEAYVELVREDKRLISAAKREGRQPSAQLLKEFDEDRERLALLKKASDVMGSIGGPVKEGATLEVKLLKREFGTYHYVKAHPDSAVNALNKEFGDALLEAKGRVRDAIKGALSGGTSLDRMVKASRTAELKARAGIDSDRAWRAIYALSKEIKADVHGTKVGTSGMFEAGEKMFERLGELVNDRSGVESYLRDQASAYAAAKVIGEASEALGRSGNPFEIPKFFSGVNPDDYVPKANPGQAKAPDKSPSKKSAAKSDFMAKLVSLDEYYVDLKPLVGSGDLDKRIAEKIAAAKLSSADEVAFTEARGLVNEAWIRFASGLDDAAKRDLLKNNAKTMTAQEQDSLLNMELVLFLEKNGAYYAKGALPEGSVKFAKGIAEKRFKVDSYAETDFAMNADWEELWKNAWKVYYRLRRGEAEERPSVMLPAGGDMGAAAVALLASGAAPKAKG